MLTHLILSSLFALAVIVLRAVFRKRVSARILYALWVLVFLRFVIPVSPLELEVLPPVETAETPAEPAAGFADDSPFETVTNSPTEQSGGVSGQVPVATPLWTKRALFRMLDLLWAVGAAAFLTRAVIIYVRTARKLSKGKRLLDQVGRFNVYVSDYVPTACAFGFIPAVYLSSEAAESSHKLLYIRHEAEHIRRLDCLRGILRELLRAVFWWNPVVWFYIALAKRDSELVCDEVIASSLDDQERVTYARLIVESSALKKPLGAGIGGKPVRKRVAAILSPGKKSLAAAGLALVLALCFVFGSIITLSRAQAEPKPDPEPVPDTSDPPVISLPDLSKEDMMRILDDGTGELRWPAEYLPDGFPVPVYDRVFSVERTEGVLRIVLCGGFNYTRVIELTQTYPVWELDSYLNEMIPAGSKLEQQLLTEGYVRVQSVRSSNRRYADRFGNTYWVNQYISSSDDPEIQEAIQSSGDSQFAWTIEYKSEDLHESWFATYPEKYKNIGFPDLGVVETFPREQLPKNLRNLDQKVTVLETSVNRNGIRICVLADRANTAALLDTLDKAGFIRRNELYIDSSGNSLYVYEDVTYGTCELATVCLVRPAEQIAQNSR